MSTQNSFSLKFILKETKLNKAGEAPIYVRVTVNRKTAEISIKRHLQPSKWNEDTQKAKGNNEAAQSLNHYIDKVRSLQAARKAAW